MTASACCGDGAPNHFLICSFPSAVVAAIASSLKFRKMSLTTFNACSGSGEPSVQYGRIAAVGLMNIGAFRGCNS